MNDGGDQHIRFELQVLQRHTDDARAVLDLELQRFDLAVGQAVHGLHAAAARVIERADIARQLLSHQLFRRDVAVDAVAEQDLSQMLAVDLGDDLRHIDALGVHRGDDVVLIVAGQGHKGVAALEPLLGQHLADRAVAVDDARIGHKVAE